MRIANIGTGDVGRALGNGWSERTRSAVYKVKTGSRVRRWNHRPFAACAAALLLFVFALPAPASTAANNEEVLFRVKVSNVGLQNSSLINGKQPTDWVEIRLPGHLYDPPKRFSPVSKQAANWNTPIDAAVADFSAFKADEKDWIVEDFVPAEKSSIVGLLNDKSAREKNKALFGRRTQRTITGEAVYKEYSIVFVRDSGQAHPVPLVFKKTPRGYKRTNALSQDETFDIVFSALYNGGNVTSAK